MAVKVARDQTDQPHALKWFARTRFIEAVLQKEQVKWRRLRHFYCCATPRTAIVLATCGDLQGAVIHIEIAAGHSAHGNECTIFEYPE
jgi:hypothetical protein